jgi:hypothetical protein
MAKAAQPVRVAGASDPNQNTQHPGHREHASREIQRTTIQVSPPTKDYLDKIKDESGVETYDKAILFLIRERRKKLPSSFGKLPTIGSFVREEEDPYRIRH